MKRIISFWILCLTSLAVVANGQVRLSLTKDVCTPRHLYLSFPRADIDEITPFANTIKYNYGDSIVELLCPSILNQGTQQESCLGWAFGYGCASIQAYDKYQDWDWAMRSPSYIYNQISGTTCDSVRTDIFIDSLVQQGICSYYLMPYDSIDCSTQPDSIQRADAALNKCLRLRLSNTKDTLEYRQLLQIGHPIGVVTKYATDLLTLCNTPSSHGRWISISNNDTTKSHALCIIGYDDHQRLFKAMNSWGVNSGDSGYVWISYNLVQNGVFSEAYVFDSRGTGFVPLIEGPEILTDSAWYYIRNVPAGATITWSITNRLNTFKTYYIASPQGADSIYVANRNANLLPPVGPGIQTIYLDSCTTDVLPSVYHRGVLSATITYGTETYTVQKTIKEPLSTLSTMLTGDSKSQSNIENTQYTYELWHSIYGLMRTQKTQNADEQIDTAGLPQGIYILLLKDRNGDIVEQKKIMKNN